MVAEAVTINFKIFYRPIKFKPILTVKEKTYYLEGSWEPCSGSLLLRLLPWEAGRRTVRAAAVGGPAAGAWQLQELLLPETQPYSKD